MKKRAGALRSGFHLVKIVSVDYFGDSFFEMPSHRRAAAVYIFSSCYVRVMVVGRETKVDDALILWLYSGSAPHQLLDFVPVHLSADKICKLYDFGLAGLIAAGLIRPP